MMPLFDLRSSSWQAKRPIVRHTTVSFLASPRFLYMYACQGASVHSTRLHTGMGRHAPETMLRHTAPCSHACLLDMRPSSCSSAAVLVCSSDLKVARTSRHARDTQA